jgi:hypothetical protein
MIRGCELDVANCDIKRKSGMSVYQFTQQEFTDLMSQTVISKARPDGRRKLSWAFIVLAKQQRFGKKRYGS